MKYILSALIAVYLCSSAIAQGPPITADKPIMLGSGSIIVKTLTQIMTTDEGTFTSVPLMVHYLPTSNSLVAVHIPWTTFDHVNDLPIDGSYLGDIGIMAKYQFYRKDMRAKTFRMVVKMLQSLPTGKDYGPHEISAGKYQNYIALVAGYETIKHGISAEVGYSIVPNSNLDEYRARLGFGLPLLKPRYPVNQLNLYFEYGLDHSAEGDYTKINMSQGIQYAKGRLTVEAALQLPLYQRNVYHAMNSNILLGTRYIF